MTIYLTEYRKYSSDEDARVFYVVAPTFLSATTKAISEVKKRYGYNVASLKEVYKDAVVAK